MMLRIAIIGIGAMGCLFSAYLSPLTSVALLGNWPQQLAALQNGLTLVTPTGKRRALHVRATNAAQTIGPVDIALVLVKSFQTQQAARDARVLLSDHGLAVTLQNGLGNVEALASVLGVERVVAGSTTDGATLIAPAIVHHAGRGEIILPHMKDRRTDLVLELASLLDSAGFSLSWTNEIEAVLWQKVAVNAAINPLTALIEARNGFLVSSNAARLIATNAAREAALVAQARGYAVDPDSASQRALAVAQSTGRNLSSMLQDLRKGRPTELDAITGEVIRAGQEDGMPTPYNQALFTLLRLKLRGTAWPESVPLLPPDLQPHFRQLHREGQRNEIL